MGIKKIARPINKAKNEFVKWLKERDAECIEIYEGDDPTHNWDYYRCVSAFIGESLYTVYFMMWGGVVDIEYNDEENSYKKLSVEEFTELLR